MICDNCGSELPKVRCEYCGSTKAVIVKQIPQDDDICTFNSLINAAICETVHGVDDGKVVELRHRILRIIREELK